MTLIVPPNSRALVVLPEDDEGESDGVWVGSGRYSFECLLKASCRQGWLPKPIIPIMRKPEPESIA